MKANYRHLDENIDLDVLEAAVPYASLYTGLCESDLPQRISGNKEFADVAKSPQSSKNILQAEDNEFATFALMRDQMSRIAASSAMNIFNLGIDPDCVIVNKKAGTVTILPYPLTVSDIEEGENDGI